MDAKNFRSRRFLPHDIEVIKLALMAELGGLQCKLPFRAYCMYAGVMLDNLKRGFADEETVLVDEYTLRALDEALVARYEELSGRLLDDGGDPIKRILEDKGGLAGNEEAFEHDAVNTLAAMATVLGCTKALRDYLNDITAEEVTCEEKK